MVLAAWVYQRVTALTRVFLACITGALAAKRGERGILREARNEFRAPRKMSRSPRLAHKASGVMQVRFFNEKIYDSFAGQRKWP